MNKLSLSLMVLCGLATQASEPLRIEEVTYDDATISIYITEGYAPYRYLVNENGADVDSVLETFNTDNGTIEFPDREIIFRKPTVTPVTCCGADNGTILLKEDQISGGQRPYTYSIGTNVGFIPVGEPFMNLEAGAYPVTVKDSQGTTSNSIRVIVRPAKIIRICSVFTTPARCPKEDGTIRVFAKSKVSLQYALEDGPFQESPLFTCLAPGKYTVIVNRRGDDMSECVTCCVKVERRNRKRVADPNGNAGD